MGFMVCNTFDHPIYFNQCLKWSCNTFGFNSNVNYNLDNVLICESQYFINLERRISVLNLIVTYVSAHISRL